ncbi:MAG: hypothetical protein K6U80_01570 [Firmicutes bacterium]|nr:hypothetical protein [Bacillota bacterium]
MLCLDCGNCRKGAPLFYCTGRNEFIATETAVVREKTKNGWRKGDPRYEEHRRQIRKEKIPQT